MSCKSCLSLFFSLPKYASLSIVMVAIPIVASTATAMTGPSKGPAIYSRIFVPHGFDSNDHIQIVGSGVFENGCYRPAEATAKVDETAKRITITAAAYKYDGICTQMILPYDRVIDIGIVPAGDYSIVQDGQKAILGRLHVDEARTSEPDDFSYAPVKQAYIDEQTGGKPQLVVKGVFSTSCAKIKEVRVETNEQVIVVQPIMEIEKRSDCVIGSFPFRESVPVDLPKGEYLLHVRSMNANAINNLVDLN